MNIPDWLRPAAVPAGAQLSPPSADAGANARDRSEGSVRHPHVTAMGGFISAATAAAEADHVQVRLRNGIWEVKVDGVFRGDYHREEDARAAAETLRREL
jgi:hypothetical protein